MAERRSALQLKLHVRETAFAMAPEAKPPIQEIFGALVPDEARNALIERDIMEALSAGRSCLILSHRREHCRLLAERLAKNGKAPFVLNGSQGKKERVTILKAIQETPADKDMAVVATGQYLGEGFDCPRLNTLFMAFPVSFKGKLVQYAGRILRELPGKTTVEVYDYVDAQVPELKHMFFRRHRTYKALGFETNGDSTGEFGGLNA
jgi:superfamily II DNA or RNA helicase